MHAENHAILNFIKNYDEELLKKSTLLVMRARKIGFKYKTFQWGISKPCVGCSECILNYGIKNVYYSTNVNGVYEKL